MKPTKRQRGRVVPSSYESLKKAFGCPLLETVESLVCPEKKELKGKGEERPSRVRLTSPLPAPTPLRLTRAPAAPGQCAVGQGIS